jgi:hypothetical protein
MDRTTLWSTTEKRPFKIGRDERRQLPLKRLMGSDVIFACSGTIYHDRSYVDL